MSVFSLHTVRQFERRALPLALALGCAVARVYVEVLTRLVGSRFMATREARSPGPVCHWVGRTVYQAVPSALPALAGPVCKVNTI